jgi:hypothetical protein
MSTDLTSYRGDLPVVPGEVEAWRAWTVRVTGYREPRLWSLFFDVVWPTDGWLVAEGDHGICAARDREHLIGMHQYGDRRWGRYVQMGEATAVGRVGLAGVIIPGDRGFRAEKARPLSILLPYAQWELVEPLRRAYRVPVGLSNVLIAAGGHRGHRS